MVFLKFLILYTNVTDIYEKVSKKYISGGF